MAKRIVVSSGSPRRGGKSDLLCDQFMAGALLYYDRYRVWTATMALNGIIAVGDLRIGLRT